MSRVDLRPRCAIIRSILICSARGSRARCARASQGWTSTDDEVRAFLDLHAGEPVAADLRNAWLSSLAARGQWQTLADRFDSSIADPALRCQDARAQR